MESKYRNIKETYKIENTLGVGNFATVKKCKNRVTGERFAVKIVRKDRMSENDKFNLQTEIEICKTIDHPHVVKFIDVFENEKHICLVMELMKGGDLFQSIV